MSVVNLFQGQNILDASIVSNDPLRIKVTIPKGSQFREFSLGNRIIVDVYDPPQGPVPSKKMAKEDASPASQQQDKAEEKPEALTPTKIAEGEVVQEPDPEQLAGKDEKVATEEKAEEPKKKAEREKPEMPGAFVERRAKAARDKRSAEIEKRKAEAEQKEKQSYLEVEAGKEGAPTIINWATTKSVNSAVFEKDGKLYILTEPKDPYLRPQINGADVPRFSPIRKEELPKGKLFMLPCCEDYTLDVQGGGLSWRLVLSEGENDLNVIFPERREASGRGAFVWPLRQAKKIIVTEAPDTGERLFIVSVETGKSFAGKKQEFVEFDVLTSYAGMAILSRVDDLSVKISGDNVEVSRPGGLVMMAPEDLVSEHVKSRPLQVGEVGVEDESFGLETVLYHFSDWKLVDLKGLDQSQAVMLSALSKRSEAGQTEDLIVIAKMHISHGRGNEALGFLNLVAQELPEVTKNPEYLALRGVANALAGKSVDALRDLFDRRLNKFAEVKIWKSFALADLEDWQQAASLLPTSFSQISTYPASIRNDVALRLAEVALRAGDVESAEILLEMVEPVEDNRRLAPWHRASLDYLKGEAEHQRGNIEETKKLWEGLVKGKDDLYRAKAGLALARLLTIEEELPQEDVVDRLEALRYGWRGDSLEANINYWLGKAYFDTDQYIKGLKIMRNAASLGQNDIAKRRIIQNMTDAFMNVFLTDTLDKVPPFEAMAIYEQFSELIPPGDDGNQMTERLAEYLAQSNLLDKSIELFTQKFNRDLAKFDSARLGVRTAALMLLNEQPNEALDMLDDAEKVLKEQPNSKDKRQLLFDLSLLRARGLSRIGNAEQAIELLEDMPLDANVSRLRADIAWSAGYWDDASHALEDVIIEENISLTRPLMPRQANLLLNRAVALNLASDRIALANMREKYGDLMSQTEKAKVFDVITRPRQSAALADRATLMSIVSEADLFKGFLDSYRTAQPVTTPVN